MAPTDRERSQLLVAEGDAAYADHRLDEAISKYRASYYGLSPDDQASYVGSLPVRKAMRAYEQLIASEQDEAKRRSLLQRQRLLLVEFLDAIASKDGTTNDVGEDVLAELEEKRRTLDEALVEPEINDEPSLEPLPADESQEFATTNDNAQPNEDQSPPLPLPSRDPLGLGLVIGGGASLLAGVGVSIGYFTIRRGADALIQAGGEDRTPEQLATYREQEHARAQKFLVAGSIVGGVGLAIAISGAVHLVLHRRRTPDAAATLRLSPALSLTPTTAGLTLHRRF